MTHDIYNKKCMSRHCKIRHYNTIVESAALYASETPTLHTKTDMENSLKEERKIMRKILGPRLANEEFQKHHRESDLTEHIRKGRLHISKLLSIRLTKRILTYRQRIKSTTPWITHIKIWKERK
ncbi:hypothetical protein HHI36_016201 [Cryptolaemus montrouzieri]|uniref:Uncharacterized protein n=1 Tax=Cryptolaemus montrouzieri TaxID=559131 RepID=A0ABD2NJF6_9CUCU